MNCHFPDLEADYENDMDGAKEVRNAYRKADGFTFFFSRIWSYPNVNSFIFSRNKQ